MSTGLRIEQLLKGKCGSYRITKKIHETVWCAKDQAEKPVVVKYVQGHHRVANERDILRHFQSRNISIRSLRDEIDVPSEADPTIVLDHFDDDLLNVSKQSRLTDKEIKFISKQILEVLDHFHSDGFVHTDLKPDNVLVDYGADEVGGRRVITDVRVADFGSTSRVDSEYAINGAPIGAPIWRSPEAQLNLPWGTATDIWSFGAMVISFIYGDNFNLFRPRTGTKFGDDDYELQILIQQFKYFGPFPPKYGEYLQGDEEALAVIQYILDHVPTLTPFSRTVEYEVGKADNRFICRIMKMDPRDRPTARDLLNDSWFTEAE